MARFCKKTALTLFCLFRQAERSVHYALSCPSQWPQFIAYYDKDRQTRIIAALEKLAAAGAGRGCIPTRDEFEKDGFWHIIGYVIGAFSSLLLNPWKRSWAFSLREVDFFFVTIKSLLKILRGVARPGHDRLIDFRMECYTCQSLIKRKLIGMVEVSKADAIEHFYQSDHVRHVTSEDVGIQDAVGDRVAVRSLD